MLESHWYSGDLTPVAYRLKDSLEAALYSIDEDVTYPSGYQEVEGFFDDNIKINKLSHRAVKRWNLPLIHSWYRYGQIVPYDELQPDHLSPEPLDSPAGSSSNLPSASGAGNIPDREYIRDWFLDLSSPSLEEIMRMDLFDFLEWDYERYAPGKYKDIYLTNLYIIQVLEEIKYDENLEENAMDYRADLKEYAMDLTYLISSTDTFDEVVENLIEGALRSIQDALITLSETTDPSNDQIMTVKNSRVYYHKKAWVWPAHLITLDRARGPEEYVHDFTDAWNVNLQEIETTYPSLLEEFQKDIIESGLQPSGKEYQKLQKPGSEEISAFGDKLVTL